VSTPSRPAQNGRHQSPLRVAVVGGGDDAAPILELLLGVDTVRLVAVAHPDPAARALAAARQRGTPVVTSHRAVFDYDPEIVVDATGARDVSADLERNKPDGVELIAARSTALFREAIGARIREAQRIEKAEKIRRMTGGVYHSLNNLFTTLLGRSSLMADAVRRGRATPAQLADNLALIGDALAHGAATVKRLRNLMGDTEAAPVERIDVRTIGRDVVALVDPLIREREARSGTIDVRVAGDDVPPVLGRASELIEVMLNLLVNAIEAMPEGGTLGVEVATDAGEVVLRVRDTGVGIPATVQEKLFTPFFTTKVGGTGLGLNVSREMVRRLGGDITVESVEGRGTTLTVRLPAADPDLPDLRGWRVLVADDDPLSRAVVVELLHAAGCDSEGVPGGTAALASLQERPYDLVLLDVFMPDLPGWEVARAASRLDRPPIVALFSGADVDPADPIIRDSGADLVLHKPIRLSALLQAVQRVRRRRGAAQQ
jgi:signal transduction histidine kinase